MQQTVVIAGGTGTIGAACTAFLREQGFRVRLLSRQVVPDASDVIRWDPGREWIEENVLDGAHVVIHLTGRALPDQRWTRAYKEILYESRTIPAAFLGKLIADCQDPPQTYIGMSAAGIYGDTGSRIVTEADVPESSDRFVVELVMAWEEAHKNAGQGLRTVILRCPPVMTMEAGFLPRILGPTRFGLYPYFGMGRQMLSWLVIDDLCRAMHHAITTTGLEGTFNIAAQEVVTSRQFIRQVRSVNSAAGILIPVPGIMIRLMYGEMAQILFDSIHVSSEKFRGTGFRFAFDELEGALRHLLSS